MVQNTEYMRSMSDEEIQAKEQLDIMTHVLKYVFRIRLKTSYDIELYSNKDYVKVTLTRCPLNAKCISTIIYARFQNKEEVNRMFESLYQIESV